ncbi:MAG: NADH-ubiquinone oxidoreductase-F iron-sulfur binding region domain-containing protein [Haloarculaceae archaeon]
MTVSGGAVDGSLRVSGGTTSSPGELVDAARRQGDSVRVGRVGSTGVPALEPLVLVTENETTGFYPRCDVETVQRLVDELESNGVSLLDAAWVVDHESDRTTTPVPADGPLGVGTRRALGPCGWLEPTSVDDYSRYTGDLLVELPHLVGVVDDAGLLGRGRGDARTDRPLADDWRTAAAADGDPVVVVNGAESDDRVRADRLLLSSAPLTVIDPAVALADEVGATDVVVTVSRTDDLALKRVRNAADGYESATDVDIDIQVVATPDEYEIGEMTMLLEALEGNDRIEARRRPPGPSEYGLHGRPTLVHTPRTFAQIAALARDGPAGDAEDPGTRLVTVGGDVRASVTVEVATDAPLSTVTDAVDVDGTVKAACVGGVFGGFTPTLEVPASADGLAAEKLGTNGAVEVLTEGRCVLASAGTRATFAHENNCGRCVPCREGSKQLTDLLRDVYDGRYDRAKIEELTRVMESTSLCDFGVAAARPVATALERFADEFAAHADGECPSGACLEQREVHV